MVTYVTDEPDIALNPLITTVTYCNRRANGVCRGACTTYTGGARCFDAVGTQCLRASHNVGFCDRTGAQAPATSSARAACVLTKDSAPRLAPGRSLLATLEIIQVGPYINFRWFLILMHAHCRRMVTSNSMAKQE